MPTAPMKESEIAKTLAETLHNSGQLPGGEYRVAVFVFRYVPESETLHVGYAAEMTFFKLRTWVRTWLRASKPKSKKVIVN